MFIYIYVLYLFIYLICSRLFFDMWMMYTTEIIRDGLFDFFLLSSEDMLL